MRIYQKPLIIGAMFFASCAAKQPKEKAWDNLLNTDISTNWHTYGKDKVQSAWTIENGILQFNPKGVSANDRGDLVSNKVYENFHLKYDWKISKNGNSGVMFNVNDDASKYQHPYLTGPEMQVLDNEGHPDAKIFKHRAGDLYDLIPSKSEPVKPYGEWNHAEIILNKGKLQLFLNGQNVVETTLWDKNWDALVAGSKFKEWPDFGKYHSGKIVFQDHGDQVWYKNILIQKL